MFPSTVTFDLGQQIAPQPIQFELPKDIPTKADLRELQNQLSIQAAQKAELENVLNGITNKIVALQESVDGANVKIVHVESAIPKIDVKQIEGLQKELTLLLQTVEQLEYSHNVPSVMVFYDIY